MTDGPTTPANDNQRSSVAAPVSQAAIPALEQKAGGRVRGPKAISTAATVRGVPHADPASQTLPARQKRAGTDRNERGRVAKPAQLRAGGRLRAEAEERPHHYEFSMGVGLGRRDGGGLGAFIFACFKRGA